MSLLFGVRSVVVVSLSFRGVSCSVPRLPLLNRAFFRTSQSCPGRHREELGPTVQVGPTGGTFAEVRGARFASDYDSYSFFLLCCIHNGLAVQRLDRDYQFNQADVGRRFNPVPRCRTIRRRVAATRQLTRTPCVRHDAARAHRLPSERCRLAWTYRMLRIRIDAACQLEHDLRTRSRCEWAGHPSIVWST